MNFNIFRNNPAPSHPTENHNNMSEKKPSTNPSTPASLPTSPASPTSPNYSHPHSETFEPLLANQMYGPRTHSHLLSDEPRGTPILTCKNTYGWLKRYDMIRGADTNDSELKHALAAMLEEVDTGGVLGPRKRLDLAVNLHFLLVKHAGEELQSERVSLHVLRKEDSEQCRVDALVDEEVVVEGAWEDGCERAFWGLRDRVEGMVYGDRKGWMGG
ncbi:hypothetical protein P280DRAFT_475021 [Massarina eburnea CBS 473.64]|uniref:Uncharacterized protein n=1 Tax=Massarina eburnea CBS 473.64 TaxID=1395130 RepID=A0A6A6SHA0_9PLEO|nr:hypothetical protein P280DRAFT_475021 [Massarina eburnea CBS 473.64]